MGRPVRAGAAAAALAALALAAGEARAQSGFGLGIIVGEPTGLSVKNWLGGGHAIDAAAAWSFSGRDSVQLHADFLVHDRSLVRARGAGPVPLYYGVGARVRVREDGDRDRDGRDSVVGIRVPLGLAHELDEAPVELFAEIVPVLDLVPDSELGLNAAVGARYYFR